MDSAAHPPKHLDALLIQHLGAYLGAIEPGTLALLREHLSWVELRGGQALMTQGEAGDAMYLLVSGRLRTYIAADGGPHRMVREVSRGQIVGEMSLYTDEPRTATVVAIRDSVLVRLGKEEFKRLLALSAQVSVAITRQIIQRLQTEGTSAALDRPVAMGLLPITAGLDLAGFADRLAAQLRPLGRVAVVDAASLDAELGTPGITARAPSDAEANRRIAVRLDEIEAGHDFVLLLADATPTPWTHRCSRHCDELLLLADADAPPVLHEIETECLANRPPRTDAAEILVLLHPADRLSPRGTAAWLARRPLKDHVHVRPELDRDMARLARLQSRTVDQGLRDTVGFSADMEDLWKGCYCVATNYSQACEQVLRRGPLLQAILASVAIPGALPPVIRDGDLLCDGGTFNNFPVDVMRGMRGVRRVIGVDLSFRKPRRIEHEELPGTWALLRDRLRPRSRRRYRLPTLAADLMNVTILYSTSRERQARRLTDLYLNPPLERVGMLDWSRFDHIVEQGYQYARQTLAEPGAAPQAAQPKAAQVQAAHSQPAHLQATQSQPAPVHATLAALPVTATGGAE